MCAHTGCGLLDFAPLTTLCYLAACWNDVERPVFVPRSPKRLQSSRHHHNRGPLWKWEAKYPFPQLKCRVRQRLRPCVVKAARLAYLKGVWRDHHGLAVAGTAVAFVACLGWGKAPVLTLCYSLVKNVANSPKREQRKSLFSLALSQADWGSKAVGRTFPQVVQVLDE